MSNSDCESSGNLMTVQASDRQEEKTDKAAGEKVLPSVGCRSVVHGLRSQSVAPSYSELNTWCHGYDPGAVKIC